MDKPQTTNNEGYDKAVCWLYDRIDYERIRPSGQCNPFRLERIQQLLERIDSPHLRIPAVHIAGTKGKGSTAAMTDSILRSAGLNVGLFTSPHIVRFEERMRVNGAMPNPAQLVELVDRVRLVLEEFDHSGRSSLGVPTFFEITTLLAWMFFDNQQVDIVVLETGLGGRLDCTNVCSPLVTIITSIGLDHTHILGNTVALIAAEKAGIIKPSVPVVQGMLPPEADQVVRDTAFSRNSERLRLGTDFDFSNVVDSELGQSFRFSTDRNCSEFTQLPALQIPLVGQHQVANASLAVQACLLLCRDKRFSILPSAIAEGLRSTFWPLRFEQLQYSGHTLIVDAAHNPDSIEAFLRCLECRGVPFEERILIFAASADKDAAAMLKLLVPHFKKIILTRFVGNPRSIPPRELVEKVIPLNTSGKPHEEIHVSPAENPDVAIKLALQSGSEGMTICVTGSLFLAAEVRTMLCGGQSPFAVFP
ncbi:MAG: folylpolyglutamate synthase/dihydrofolate synthase family protein [Planctomycetaceae bacterium]